MRSDYEKIILRFLKFHSYVIRAMTLVEIGHHLRSCGLSTPLEKIEPMVSGLVIDGSVRFNGGFYSTADIKSDSRRKQDVLYDMKWRKFLRRSRVFKYLPCVEAVLGSGSMSIGNVHIGSDFDVLIIAKTGRIFTARFFCMLILGILGFRRSGIDHKDSVSDKICLNHFVTKKNLRLDDYNNLYRHELYYNLVPMYGSENIINEFYEANNWVGKRFYFHDRRFNKNISIIKTIFEFILSNYIGDKLEKILKIFQLKRIYKNLYKNIGYRPRLKFSDHELEFHPNTGITENWENVI